MRHLVTVLLALLAFVAGSVLTGYLGDQRRGLDAAPLAVGVLLAAGVIALRLSRRRTVA
ncbi:hypothetical protein [Nigerium massiliense]|uniref:hypothetical protein n=1 Tax=Nigerium massiliense TaxID=1522317 RepID=UPI0012FD2E17|nr:hypothetical protein [Nigerium massiliense]